MSKSVLVTACGIENTTGQRILELIGSQTLTERLGVILSRLYGWGGFYCQNTILMMFITLFVLFMWAIRSNRLYIHFELGTVVLMMLLCVYPMAWHFVFADHSGWHGAASMLHVISMYGLLIMISTCFIKDSKLPNE